MLQILPAKHYADQELPGVQAGLRKGRGTRGQIASLHWIIEKAREFQKLCTSTSVSSTVVKPLTVWIIINCGKPLKEVGITEHLTCLLRNLCVGQEATVRTLYGTTDSFKIEKGVREGCLLSPCLFNLYAEHIMRNTGLDELQTGINIGRSKINNPRYVDDTTLKTESKKELKSLLMRLREESERANLKLKITKIMASGPITSWQIEGEKVKVVTAFLFLALKSLQVVTAAMKSEDDCFLAGKR